MAFENVARANSESSDINIAKTYSINLGAKPSPMARAMDQMMIDFANRRKAHIIDKNRLGYYCPVCMAECTRNGVAGGCECCIELIRQSRTTGEDRIDI